MAEAGRKKGLEQCCACTAYGSLVRHSRQKTCLPPARLITVGLACSHINNLRRKLVLAPNLFPIVSVKCGEQERENGENVRVRIAYIQLTTSVELGGKIT
jgi:hypothetical protein